VALVLLVVALILLGWRIWHRGGFSFQQASADQSHPSSPRR